MDRDCNNPQCLWTGDANETVALDGIEPILLLCPKCGDTTEECEVDNEAISEAYTDYG